MPNHKPLALLSLLLAAACGPTEDPIPTPGETSAWGQLSRSRTFELDLAACTASVTARRTMGGELAADAALPVLGGSIGLRAQADGTLVLEGLEVGLDDVVLTAEQLPPRGLHLTGITIGLAARATAATDWDGGDSAEARGDLDLVLDWAILTESGEALPLGTPRLARVPVAVSVTGGPAGPSVGLSVRRDGVFWKWAGLLELADLSIDLAAR